MDKDKLEKFKGTHTFSRGSVLTMYMQNQAEIIAKLDLIIKHLDLDTDELGDRMADVMEENFDYLKALQEED